MAGIASCVISSSFALTRPFEAWIPILHLTIIAERRRFLAGLVAHLSSESSCCADCRYPFQDLAGHRGHRQAGFAFAFTCLHFIRRLGLQSAGFFSALASDRISAATVR